MDVHTAGPFYYSLYSTSYLELKVRYHLSVYTYLRTRQTPLQTKKFLVDYSAKYCNEFLGHQCRWYQGSKSCVCQSNKGLFTVRFLGGVSQIVPACG